MDVRLIGGSFDRDGAMHRSGSSATRSFSTTSVDPGGTVTVTTQADNYGGVGTDCGDPAFRLHQPMARAAITVTIRLLSAWPPGAETIHGVTASDGVWHLHLLRNARGSRYKVTTPIGRSGYSDNYGSCRQRRMRIPARHAGFSATSVPTPGEEITVTIRADDYGGLGRILETLPSGFTSPGASGQTT